MTNTEKLAEALRKIRGSSMSTYGWDADCMVEGLQQMADEALSLYEQAKGGEFICERCGLRQEGEKHEPSF